MFHFMFVHYTFSSVWIAGWPPFGRWLPARLAICYHCISSICSVCLFPVLVLGAGFAFSLHQFLLIAFLLLSLVRSLFKANASLAIKSFKSGTESTRNTPGLTNALQKDT